MAKTYEEINEKIKKGQAVVVTAEEIIDIVAEKGLKKAAHEVDVVTTGTFGPMCSSGAFLNFGHSTPRIKLGGGHAYLGTVPVYTGLAAADVYIGATAIPDDDPRNKVYPGEFNYGGGHVIEDLIAGKDLVLNASAYGTDCYPRKKLETLINIQDINEAILFSPRNAYQNYNCAVNLTDKIIYTYMGVLQANLGNANFCSAAQLSPLLNDPLYKTIGIGTRIFLGGGIGYVAWNGTQHNPAVKRKDNGVPQAGAGTLSVIGDLKQMDPKYLRGASFLGYGATLTVGIGVPIPILNEEICQYTAVRNQDIWCQIVDYGKNYPNNIPGSLGEVNYAQLFSGEVECQGKKIPAAPISSYSVAREIAATLKDWIKKGSFELTKPVQTLPGPGNGIVSKVLKERPVSPTLE
ncbi:MAG: homocysteine biosynthesis protein [bacterium]|nr:homocysteine biosynthesis protein [bacterium]MDD5354629.1 homocysteine biosynthesis protein [bacterium]MDD5756651.1 homocysteine biosynthesis protein [bacterium]